MGALTTSEEYLQEVTVGERAKRELAARTWKHRQHDADAKSDVVREISSAVESSRAPG